MSLEAKIKQSIEQHIQQEYHKTVEVQITKTKKEFEGQLTAVLFALSKILQKNPIEIGEKIGQYVLNQFSEIEKYNIVKGFLNIVLKDEYLINYAKNKIFNEGYYKVQAEPKNILIEFSSPNTNKPLHLGHVRNNLIGNALANLFEACGHRVYKVNLVNDRGVHICKSMLAWKLFGAGETPEQAGMKGDKFVGKYYVLYEQKYRQQVAELVKKGHSKQEAEAKAPLKIEVRKMLIDWENNDKEVRALWSKMNNWVYDGFDITYRRMGIDFHTIYKESETYLLGKDMVMDGLKTGIFYQKEDGSVWADLTKEGLDNKILIRSDGTSVYITQDLGTTEQKYQDHQSDEMLWVVADEQNYHFNVLFEIMKKMGKPYAEHLIHVSYGMVDLPHGRMKSREGTVVDADDLLDQMYQKAKKQTEALGKVEDMDNAYLEKLYEVIGQGALKYFLLKIDPKKRIVFDSEKSLEFQGQTGPFIQYTHARICSLLEKANAQRTDNQDGFSSSIPLESIEREILALLHDYPSILLEAVNKLNPGILANYLYDLVKTYNSFYQDYNVLSTPNLEAKHFRLTLSYYMAYAIKTGMKSLGIQVPVRM